MVDARVAICEITVEIKDSYTMSLSNKQYSGKIKTKYVKGYELKQFILPDCC